MAHITSIDGYLTDEDIKNASKAFSKYEREDDKRPITTLLLGILLNGMTIEVFADSDPERDRFTGWLRESAINAPGKAFGVQVQGTDDLKEFVGKPGPYTVFFYHADHGSWWGMSPIRNRRRPVRCPLKSLTLWSMTRPSGPSWRPVMSI